LILSPGSAEKKHEAFEMFLFVMLTISAVALAAFGGSVEQNSRNRLATIMDKRVQPTNFDIIEFTNLGAMAASASIGAFILSIAALIALFHWFGWL
jgi:hypothetical protein